MSAGTPNNRPIRKLLIIPLILMAPLMVQFWQHRPVSVSIEYVFGNLSPKQRMMRLTYFDGDEPLVWVKFDFRHRSFQPEKQIHAVRLPKGWYTVVIQWVDENGRLLGQPEKRAVHISGSGTRTVYLR